MSSSIPTTPVSNDRYSFANAGPSVTDKGSKLVGKSLSSVQAKVLQPLKDRNQTYIESNVRNEPKQTGNESAVSDITSAADLFNLYRFDEMSALNTYKKMMTLHLKDEMFCKLKFITNDSMLEFSRQQTTLCGYVCTSMRVPDHQWGDYWDLVKKSTKKMIEQQRTNATSAIKKGFRGT